MAEFHLGGSYRSKDEKNPSILQSDSVGRNNGSLSHRAP